MGFRDLADTVVGLCNKVFGEDFVSYTPSGGSPNSIRAVFSNDFVEVEGVVSLKPILRVQLSELENSPAKGDAVTINSVNYLVTESRIDGFGGSSLILKKV